MEMAGIVTLKCTVIKNGVEDMAMRNPMFLPGPVQPQFGSGRMPTVSTTFCLVAASLQISSRASL